MKEQLITFQTAKLAKEKGFDYGLYTLQYNEKEEWEQLETTPHYYPQGCKSCKVSTQSLLQKWLREVHNINVYCMPSDFEEKKWFNNIASHSIVFTSTYEEALELGLQQALKLITSPIKQ